MAEQDYNPLPLKLILKWIHLAEYFVIVGSVLGEFFKDSNVNSYVTVNFI